MSVIRSNECPVCFGSFQNPYIHSSCGNTMDYHCVEEALGNFGRCPICNVNASLADFKPNVSLRDVLQETADKGVQIVREITPITLRFSPSVNRGDRGFENGLHQIKKVNRSLYDAHINKESTRKIRADWGHNALAIYKSGKWRFFDLQKGGEALVEEEKFEKGAGKLKKYYPQ